MTTKLPYENWCPPPPPVCFGRINTKFGCSLDSKGTQDCAFTKLCIIYRDVWLEKEAYKPKKEAGYVMLEEDEDEPPEEDEPLEDELEDLDEDADDHDEAEDEEEVIR